MLLRDIRTLAGFAVITLVAICLLLTGCRRSESEKRIEQSSPEPKKTERAVMSQEEAAMLAPFAQAGSMSEADKAWNELTKLIQPPSFPEQWQTNEPSKEEFIRFQKESGKKLAELAVKTKDFYTRFPKYEKVEDARKLEFALLAQAAQLGDTNGLTRLQALEEEHLKNPDLTEDERLELRINQVQRQVTLRQDEGVLATLEELETRAKALQKEFPKRPEVAQLLVSTAQAWLEQGEAEKAKLIAQEIGKGNFEEEITEAAQEILKKANRVGKPLSLKFKGIDGREVDLEKMKGKVVLVDFWATWCRPCLVELPKVKAAYDKLHGQGFEIIGISFDDDKAALEKMLANEKMTWPQYFNAEDGGKKFGEEFGVSSIPAMWLVDKKGVLRNINAREDLAGKVEKLLSEN